MSNLLWLQILEVAKRHGLEAADPQVGQLLSKALETHLGSIVRQIFAMTRQRADTDRTRPGMVLTSNLRKQLHEINARERDRQKAQEAKEAEAQAQQVRSKSRLATRVGRGSGTYLCRLPFLAWISDASA